MPEFDAERFLYALAGRLSAGAWELAALRKVLREVPLNYPRIVSQLPLKLLAASKSCPDYYQLVELLRADASLSRILKRGSAIAGARQPMRGKLRFSSPRRFGELGLPEISNEAELAAWLGLTPPRLSWLADISTRNRRHEAGPLWPYRYRWIPKRTGLPRLLEIPKRPLMVIQRQILEEILDRIPLHPAVHGFRAGHSIRSHASEHCGREVIVQFDLRDFFPSVPAARVCRIFLTVGYPPHVSRLLAGLCTTLLPASVWEARPGGRLGADFEARQRLVSRHLPQGAPTSPALANLAASRLDRRLSGLARACAATYTRYADDLTFSGGAALARQCRSLEPLIAAIAREEGFALNHRKTRMTRAGARQQVTGVVVNVHPNIRREEYDRLKAILTNCVRFGSRSQNREGLADFRAHLQGRVAHVAAIHAVRGAKLRMLFERVDWDK